MPRRSDDGAPMIVHTYDLCAKLYAHVDRFPRAQRTLLGRMILDQALRMLAALTVANRLVDKRESLVEASGHLDATSARCASAYGWPSGWRFLPTAATRRA